MAGAEQMIKSESMLTIWRRHTADCRHRDRGRSYLKCNCPLWADGYVDGKRTLRQSLGTRDMARARKRATYIEEPGEVQQRTLEDAAATFEAHCVSDGLKDSTLRKYRNTLVHLRKFCGSRGIVDMHEITVD